MFGSYFRFRGIVDVVTLAAGLTRSRMTPKQTFHVSVSGGYCFGGNALSSASEFQLSEMLNQQFGENSDFPCGVLTGRPDHKHAARRNGIARHNLNKRAGIQIALDEVIRKPSDA